MAVATLGRERPSCEEGTSCYDGPFPCVWFTLAVVRGSDVGYQRDMRWAVLLVEEQRHLAAFAEAVMVVWCKLVRRIHHEKWGFY